MLFYFRERHELKLEIMKKYQLHNNMYGSRVVKLSNKVHEHTNQIRYFLCQSLVKLLYIFMLYLVVIKIEAGIFFRQICDMIISMYYKKKSSNVFWKKPYSTN